MNAGIFRPVLARRLRPVHQVLTGREERSTESSLEHIPLTREGRFAYEWTFPPVVCAGTATRGLLGGDTKTLKVFSPLPCLHRHLLFLPERTHFNVNSLQKDLYVYQKWYLLDILNI